LRILTAEAMREVDRRAIEELGLPSLVLMENAALGVVAALEELFPDAERVVVLCGPGNNGGDGLAVARHLDLRGYDVTVHLVAPGRRPAGDAAVQLAVCRRQGVVVEEVAGPADLVAALAGAAAADLVVDALFGTGLERPLEPPFSDLVEGLNELDVPVLAVDLPSGLTGSRSDLPGPHVVAQATVSFAAPKVAHVFPPARHAVGELVVTDLGIPPFLVAEVEEAAGELHLLQAEEVAGWLPERDPESHKGDYGHVLVVAGSAGKAGAAVMTARAAVRAGAGLVTAAVPEPLLPILHAGCLESMGVALPCGPPGALGAAAVAAVLAAAEGKDAVALGPGLGQEEETAAAVRELAQRLDLPLVLDADGLNAFAGRLGELAGRRAATVLTPHPGELGRLLGTSAAEVQADRVGAARRAAAAAGAVVVLKGHRTLIAEPPEAGRGGRVWVCPTGNPGMASGGSGDVLTGVLAALAGWIGGVPGVCLGAYVHGLAGDLAADELGEVGLAAGDLLEALPHAFERLSRLGEG
jgi:NAD(P)H-hydrate epimerase